MTINEMRDKLREHCSQHEDCGTCALNDANCSCSWSSLEDNEIESTYNLLLLHTNNVNHPAHYQGKHECIDEMIALFGVDAVRCFCMCNVYKYRFRAAQKNGAEDLAKADWYMDKLMELNDYGKIERNKT